MPAALTYPGVYIEEIPSGVRTITGVATSITAFIGRASRGPTNDPVTINSFGDFERIFGGLWLENQLGFAVRDFYLNGGSQAIIVRLYHADEGENAKASKARLTAGGAVKLEAAYEGAWGGNLRASVDMAGISDEVALALGVAKSDLFNLTARDAGAGGATERFINLTVKESARRIDRLLKAESKLVRWDGKLDDAAANAVKTALEPVTKAQTELANAKKALADKLKADPNANVDSEKQAVAAAEKKVLDEQSKLVDPVTVSEANLAKAEKTLAEKLTADPDANVDTEKQAVDTARGKVKEEKEKMSAAVSDGQHLKGTDFLPANGETEKKGMYALEEADLFNILCIPPYRTNDGVSFNVDTTVIAAATAYCEKRRAMYLIDPPSDWDSKEKAKEAFTATNEDFPGVRSKNAALFFPRLKQNNPLRENRIEEFAPCGAVAGIFARTDTQRGVWKAPAGLDATLVGVPQLEVNLTDAENGELNPLGINCLRAFPVSGRVVWGSRTLRGADQLADEWKYIPVRRTALFIEESLYRGTQWVVFEPNDEPLWAQIRLNIGAFMNRLFRQGAFQGKTPAEAYFVKCDKETNPQDQIDLGIVTIIVGFAPLKPAEFVVIKLQQMAGQIQT
jgi:phage tail sheath protein FI